MIIILAPHLDDEVIGCFSVLMEAERVIYFHRDYREEAIKNNIKYYAWEDHKDELTFKDTDTIYIPSKYDYHPLHRKVRQIGLTLPGKKMFYSVEMNTPWLEEEEHPEDKRAFFEHRYPGEWETISKNDKYFLFKSIKPYDDIIWASVRFRKEGYHSWPAAPNEVAFLASLHRHMFHFQVDVQQFGDDRDLEFFILSRKIQTWFDAQSWEGRTSCEMFCFAIKRWLETEYPERMVRVSVYEDGENGSIVE
jgi:hypothetical protein